MMLRQRLIHSACVLTLVLSPLRLEAWDVTTIEIQPQVVPTTYAGPVFITLGITGLPNRLDFDLYGLGKTILPLVDDGTHADLTANDGLYTLVVQSADIMAGNPAGVHSRELGRVWIPNGTSNPDSIGVEVPFWAPTISDPSPVVVAADVQYTDSVVNIVDSAAADFANAKQADLERVTKRFYDFFGDDYHFISVVYSPSYAENRAHREVRVPVTGIGPPITDVGAAFGSPQTLLGLSFFPILALFDLASPTALHEIGHQWINTVRLAPIDSAIPHWPVSNLATGLMGYGLSKWGAGLEYWCGMSDDPSGGIRLRRPQGPRVYSDWALYLMGLISPGKVGDAIVPDQPAFNQSGAQWSCNSVYNGSVTRRSVQDLVQVEGARSPSAATSNKHFRVATILITKNALADATTMAWMDYRARRGAATKELPFLGARGVEVVQPFHLATGGRASLSTRLTPQPSIQLKPEDQQPLPGRPFGDPLEPYARVQPGTDDVERFSSLRDAIIGAQEGASLSVSPGVTIDEDLPIVIDVPGLSIAVGGFGNLTLDAAETGLVVAADDVVISGIDVHGGEQGLVVESGSLTLRSSRLTGMTSAVSVESGGLTLEGCNQIEALGVGIEIGWQASSDDVSLHGVDITSPIAVIHSGAGAVELGATYLSPEAEGALVGDVFVSSTREEECDLSLPTVIYDDPLDPASE